MRKFEVSKKYFMRSPCDSECIWEYEVLKRTEKTVTLNTEEGNKTFRIYTAEDSERVKPLGNYSMCPILKAERIVV